MSGFVIAFVLLVGNAFFVAAEFAVLSVRRAQLEPLAQAGSRRAETALWSLQNMPLMLAGAQLGITVCSLGLGAVAEPVLAAFLEEQLHFLPIPEALLHPIAFAIALAVIVYLHVVLGEMVPKNFSIAMPVQVALLLAPPLVAFSRFFSPLIRVVNALAFGIMRLVKIEVKDGIEATVTTAQVQVIVNESQREGLLQDEAELINSALHFGSRVVRDHMVPMSQLVVLQMSASAAEIEEVIARTGFSRFPVVEQDEVRGYIHVKDLLTDDAAAMFAPMTEGTVGSSGSEGELVSTLPRLNRGFRTLWSVSADQGLQEALQQMAQTRSHLLRVRDDVDGTVGVLFMEDVLEELVGEVMSGAKPVLGASSAAEV